MKLQLKNSKKIFLALTFYFHPKTWIHLALLFFINVCIMIGLMGIFEVTNLQVFSSTITLLLGCMLFLTITEHLIKTTVSIRVLQIIMGSFGMGTSIIIIMMIVLYASVFQSFQIISVEGLIGTTFIFVFFRFNMRRLIINRFSTKVMRGIEK